ncbi:MAG: hypothetical protein R6X35_15950 [Candidatus Krumholzibacteriia bacterium]
MATVNADTWATELGASAAVLPPISQRTSRGLLPWERKTPPPSSVLVLPTKRQSRIVGAAPAVACRPPPSQA